jgi:MFS family permease
MTYVVAALAGLAFGAADQYLGNFSSLGAWAASVSGLSAPWLILPFLAGSTQDRRRRAMVVGLVVTLGALIGYVAMTYSPLENVPVSRFGSGVLAMVRSGQNPLWFAGGIVMGPVFGFLGHRWRTERSRLSAALVVATLLLEPAARVIAGMRSRPAIVWEVELVVGALAAAWFASRRERPAVSPANG